MNRPAISPALCSIALLLLHMCTACTFTPPAALVAEADSLYAYGQNYEERHLPDSAFLNYRNAIRLLEGSDAYPRLVLLYHRAGKILSEHSQPEEARHCMDRALEHALSSGDSLLISEALREAEIIYNDEEWDESFTRSKNAAKISKLNYEDQLTDANLSYHHTLHLIIVGFVLFFASFYTVVWIKRIRRRKAMKMMTRELITLHDELERERIELNRLRHNSNSWDTEKAELDDTVLSLKAKWTAHLDGLSERFTESISRLTASTEYTTFIRSLEAHRSDGVLPHARQKWIDTLIHKHFELHLHLLQAFYGLSEAQSMFYCYTRLRLSTWQTALCMGCTKETIRSYRSRTKAQLSTHADGPYLLEKLQSDISPDPDSKS